MPEIDGVAFEELGIIPTPQGAVLKMLSPQNAIRPQPPGSYGEIYFSLLEPGAVNAWKRHARQTQYFAVPCGRIRIVLYDARAESPTRGILNSHILGLPDNYFLLRIPPGIWYGFSNAGETRALICNCADLPHDPREGEKTPWNSDVVPYDWKADGC